MKKRVNKIKRDSKIMIILFIIFLIFSIYLIFKNIHEDKYFQNNYSSKELLENQFNCKDCNVIIVSLTNVQKNHLSVYDYKFDTTPNLNKFANNSIVFENAFSQTSWTLPVYTSIMTSLYPLQHGILTRDLINFNSRLSNKFITLIDVLKENDYITLGFTGGFDLREDFGVSSRYDIYDSENLEYVHNKNNQGGIRGNSNENIYGTINYSIDKAISWIENGKNNDDKFFMYIQGFDAHCPFALPSKNNKFVGKLKSELDYKKCYWSFDKEEPFFINDEIYYNLYTSIEKGTNITLGLPTQIVSKQDIEYMIRLYDGEINLIDLKIKMLFDSIKRKNLTKNTIIIVMSEHGDMFGKHGRFMRGGPLRGTYYNDVLNVPFILSHPKNNVAIKRFEQFELIDIAPTILDMLKIESPKEFIGQSIKKIYLKDEKISKYVFAMSKFTPKNNSFFSNNTQIYSIKNESFKLILEINNNIKKLELYDLINDKDELFNIATSNQGKVRELEFELDKKIFLLNITE